MDDSILAKQRLEEWITLAHVCRQWRSVIYQSPLRLNLQLVCTPQTPTRDVLDIWPPLPLIIRDVDDYHNVEPYIEDNIIAALEHNDRVREIRLLPPNSEFFTNSAAILKPFPELIDLQLSAQCRVDVPALPDSFLGGSAPRLRSFILDNVPFQGLPKLHLSSAHLSFLSLSYIPRSGYIPPEVMATTLSALTSLRVLFLQFDYPQPWPALETRRPPQPQPQPQPPLTRSILPSLTIFEFKGASEYLEVILARVDAPRLDEFRLIFFNQLIFDTPRLFQFISRRPTLMAPEKGHISFKSKAIIVGFTYSDYSARADLYTVGIQCAVSDWQLSFLEQVCTSSLPQLSTLEDLHIYEHYYEKPDWQGDVENTLWLDLLRSFIALKNLYVSEEFVPRIAPALQEFVGGRTTEVLPALENIFLEGFQPSSPLQEGIEEFVAARRLTSRPVAVSSWTRAFYDSTRFF